MLYGSDYPFSIGDMKGILARVDALAGRSARRDSQRQRGAAVRLDIDSANPGRVRVAPLGTRTKVLEIGGCTNV